MQVDGAIVSEPEPGLRRLIMSNPTNTVIDALVKCVRANCMVI